MILNSIFILEEPLFNYKLFYSSSIISWAPNKDTGIPSSLGLKVKKIAFYGDPQLWFVLNKFLDIGTRTSIYYHVLNNENRIQAYPTLGIKMKFYFTTSTNCTKITNSICGQLA